MPPFEICHQASPLLSTELEENPNFLQQCPSERVLNENVIRVLKRFKIIADRYRNRRKRFALRFNLIAGIYNFKLAL